MKHHFTVIFIVLFVISGIQVHAQNYRQKNLHFIYIEHENQTPTNKVCTRLLNRYNDVLEFPDNEALIVYLSNNGKEDFTAFVNLRDYKDMERDRADALYGIVDAIQNANSHAVAPREDVRNILDIFDHYNFIDDQNQLCFRSVTIDFYIGPEFWTALNNERVIAHLYTALQLGTENVPKGGIIFNVFKPKGIDLSYMKERPFGNKNLNGINQTLRIIEY